MPCFFSVLFSYFLVLFLRHHHSNYVLYEVVVFNIMNKMLSMLVCIPPVLFFNNNFVLYTLTTQYHFNCIITYCVIVLTWFSGKVLDLWLQKVPCILASCDY